MSLINVICNAIVASEVRGIKLEFLNFVCLNETLFLCDFMLNLLSIKGEMWDGSVEGFEGFVIILRN